MRVLFLTDSLSLPRSYPGGMVRWDDIYVCLLKKAMPAIEFIHVGIGAATITQLLQLQNYYALTQPDVVVLHCGIVDCAPRALSELELQIIKRMRMFRFVNPFARFLRKYRGITYTSLKNFEAALLKLKGKFAGVPFISIGILPGCPEYEQIVPGISKNIEKYNAILQAHTLFVDNRDFPRGGITQDCHHLNEKGHSILFEKLQKQIHEFVNRDQPE